MTEKSSIEILEEFAKRNSYRFYTHSSVYDHSLSTADRFTTTKFIVFDFTEISKNLYFIFYDLHSTKAYSGSTYCGLFKKIQKCNNEIRIIKRDWVDVLRFKKRFLSSDSYIDKEVSIFTENSSLDLSIVNSKNIRLFVDINKRISPLEMVSTRESWSIVPELNGNDLVAIKTNFWEMDFENLKYFIEKGCELMKSIQS
ncbi:MAG: hypothetical protein Q7J34_09830 [Bacteroidales bacterium]|jgi:hypothetical protein|nr:hypothetical protein [Bacteroidales bacterium]